jgi:hypothetical protein
MDSDPLGSKPVGTVINFNINGTNHAVQVWLQVVDSFLNPHNVVIHLVRDGFLSLDLGKVYFELDNCDDSGRFFIRDTGFLPAVESSVLLSTPHGRTTFPTPLYIAKAGSTPARRVIRSNTGPSNGGGCQNLISNETNLVEADLVVPNLRSIYPPPFTLEVP